MKINQSERLKQGKKENECDEKTRKKYNEGKELD